jgi:glutamate N-acetyltransferase/amino-acid N-acetyltransferase
MAAGWTKGIDSMQLPKGYRFAATYAGIRKKEALDLTLMVSDTPAAAAGVFTTNAVRAACVDISAANLKKSGGLCRAIIVNAGNANCSTPTQIADAQATIGAVAKRLSIPKREVLVCSTGVIGEPLPVRKIEDALPRLSDGLFADQFDAAAKAIMTTDTVPKTAYAEATFGGATIRVAGMAKGSGMIQPNMATMLGFLFSDAAVPASHLRKVLKRVAGRTFNRISVDGDTSTNDTVFLLANGASGVKITKAERAEFERAVESVAGELAIAIVRDGEGAKKIVTLDVEGAPDDKAAVRIARSIANSPLVKTALAGADLNWGRILCAAGHSGVRFDPAKADIFVNGHQVCKNGMRADFNETEVQATLEQSDNAVTFRLRGKGRGKARFWTCDLTEEYIRINADYRT